MRSWVKNVINEYQEKKAELEQYRKMLIESKDPKDQLDAVIIGGMIRDMQLALTWMKRGRHPGNRRGIQRRDVYHQTALQGVLTQMNIANESVAMSVLCDLSSRERLCFLAYYLEGLTQQEISIMLDVTRSTVQVTLRRAEKKAERLLE